jgi:hypothetical protein
MGYDVASPGNVPRTEDQKIYEDSAAIVRYSLEQIYIKKTLCRQRTSTTCHGENFCKHLNSISPILVRIFYHDL